jgi:hypothetical protein
MPTERSPIKQMFSKWKMWLQKMGSSSLSLLKRVYLQDGGLITNVGGYVIPLEVSYSWQYSSQFCKSCCAIPSLEMPLPDTQLNSVCRFLVIFPAIAQRVVDNANLPIWSARIRHPTPSTVEYSLIASLKVPPPLTVKLDPITLSLFVNDNTSNIVPYVNVDLPEYHLHGNTTVAITNQTAAILNKDIFESFLHNAVYSEYFTLSAAGVTNAFLGKLKAHIRLDKSIVLAG